MTWKTDILDALKERIVNHASTSAEWDEHRVRITSDDRFEGVRGSACANLSIINDRDDSAGYGAVRGILRVAVVVQINQDEHGSDEEALTSDGLGLLPKLDRIDEVLQHATLGGAVFILKGISGGQAQRPQPLGEGYHYAARDYEFFADSGRPFQQSRLADGDVDNGSSDGPPAPG